MFPSKSKAWRKAKEYLTATTVRKRISQALSQNWVFPNKARKGNLRERIHRLPQELQDMIQDFVFSADPAIQHLTRSYKPPATLQVSRKTRQKFAKSYYSQTTFRIDKTFTLDLWLRSIRRVHLRKIKNMQVRIDDVRFPRQNSRWHWDRRPDRNQTLERFAKAELFFINFYHRLRNTKLSRGGTQVNVRFDYWDEVWTKDPQKLFVEWKVWKTREVLRLVKEVSQRTRELLPIGLVAAVRHSE